VSLLDQAPCLTVQSQRSRPCCEKVLETPNATCSPRLHGMPSDLDLLITRCRRLLLILDLLTYNTYRQAGVWTYHRTGEFSRVPADLMAPHWALNEFFFELSRVAIKLYER
jgi:hypothetical protein